MSSKDFCDKLRQCAKDLAKAEEGKPLLLKDIDIEIALGDDAERVKVTPSYIRTIMNRVPEIKSAGSVSIRRIKEHPEYPDGYAISLDRETRKRVFTVSDLPGIRRKAIEKALKVNPDFSAYQGECLEAAVKAVAEYKEMIREFCIEVE